MDLTTAALVIAVVLMIVLIALMPIIKNSEMQKRWEKKRADEKQHWAEEQTRRQETERLRTTIVSTRLLGEGAAEYKKSVGSMAARGAVGSLFGPAGAVIGMATAKSKNTNQDVRRFLVKYLDGHIEEKEAIIGSAKYKEYMAHLEWESAE